MEGQSLRRWAVKELFVWTAAIVCGCLTFSSFEPLYDHAKAAAAVAGYTSAFDFDIRPARHAPSLRHAFPALPRLCTGLTLGAKTFPPPRRTKRFC